MKTEDSLLPAWVWGILALAVVLAIALAFGGYRYYALAGEYASVKAGYEAQIASITEELAMASTTASDLATNLMSERDRNDELEAEIDDLSGEVRELDKLARTDPELLAKYSKVYFLNENYKPPRLKTIEKEFTYDEAKTYQFHSQAYRHLEDMIEDAKDDDIDLFIVSAFRSFEEQMSLKSSYRVSYGTGANAFSADQGYSEHQLGTTVDLTTTGLNGGLTAAFDKTEAFAWLEDNAHKYGFVLSYPAGNAYYTYEPWHWRFVGTDLAEDLHDDGKHFYDLDQRALDKYLISIFD